MNEKRDVSDKIEAYCKTHPDYFIRKIHCGAYQGKGLPDLWGCYKGMFICCEAKTDKGRPSKLQKHYIKLINAAGGCAFIARSLEDFIQAVEKGHQKENKAAMDCEDYRKDNKDTHGRCKGAARPASFAENDCSHCKFYQEREMLYD
ncbi:MAG: hypothetical protein EUB_03958 [Eubacterium sp.]|uniref:hypothetical protein n=1 Tax=Eubacterium sp. TaxID=142586 RepID=UPI0030667585